MSDVIAFPSKERSIWVCRCGCTTHFLYDDGDAECSSCGGVCVIGGWTAKDKVTVLANLAADPHTVNRIGEPLDFILRRFKEDIDHNPDLLAATAIFRNGRVHTFIRDRSCDTDERKAWWRRRAVDFLRHIFP